MLRNAAIGLSVSRAGLGIAIGLAPRPLLVPWLGPDGTRTGAATLARMFAARDVAIGVGAASALLRDADHRSWMVAQLASDASDFAITGLARRSTPRAGRRVVMGMAATGAAIAATYLAAGDQGPCPPAAPRRERHAS